MDSWTDGQKIKKPENLSFSGFVVAGLGSRKRDFGGTTFAVPPQLARQSFLINYLKQKNPTQSVGYFYFSSGART